MAIPVNDIIKLANQGYTDSQIIKQLKQEGYTPKQINDGFNQAKVKLELNKSTDSQDSVESNQDYEGETDSADNYPYQYPEQTPAPSTYAPYPSSPLPPVDDVEGLVVEIIEDKWQEFRRKAKEITNMKDELDKLIHNFDKRLARVEKTLKKLSGAAMDKFQEHNHEIKTMKSEVHATKETLRKIMLPLTKKVKEQHGAYNIKPKIVKTVTETTVTETPPKKKKTRSNVNKKGKKTKVIKKTKKEKHTIDSIFL